MEDVVAKKILLDLETLIKRGLKLHAWVVLDKSPFHAGEIEVLINDPNKISLSTAKMKDCEYAPTLLEALTKVVKRWR